MQLMNRRRESGDQLIRAIDDATAEAVLAHGPTILRAARRYSMCAADAEDAYQRGVEILLTKAPTNDTAQLIPWLVTVVKNEALAITKQRKQLDGAAFEDGADTFASADRLPAERAEDYELIAHGAEALGRLKRDEVKALLLKADGLSYKEIATHTGWTYTKVNRCITEGRAAFRNRLTAIQVGGECERLSPMLSRFADGEVTEVEYDDVEMHVQSCLACKASLREFRAAPARVAALFPIPFVAELSDGDRAANGLQLAWQWVQERLGAATIHTHQWGEVAGAKKIAVVAAAAALATSGVAVESKLDATRTAGDKASAQPRLAQPPVQNAPTPAPTVKKRRKKTTTPELAVEPVTDPSPAIAQPTDDSPVPAEPNSAPPIEDGTADLAP